MSTKDRDLVVGFTGTREGMTAAQFHTVAHRLGLNRLGPRKFVAARHGDCIGADEQFHHVAVATGLRVEIHPCHLTGTRAYCRGDVEHPTKEPLARNRDIVDGSHFLLATPKGYAEEHRSGTWATVRYAHKQDKAVFVIWPDGSVTRYPDPYPTPPEEPTS